MWIRYEKVVVYHVLRCPICGSNRTRVYSRPNSGTLRYHECHACGGRFKSIEEDASGVTLDDIPEYTTCRR